MALANRGKTVFCLGSDGSQQEGNDAEAARIAVAQKLNVKLIVDDNDVTISGHPSQYLKGFSVAQTLSGHGLKVFPVQGEDIDSLWGAISGAVTHDGPAAGKLPYKPHLAPAHANIPVVCKRVMAVGIPDIEGTIHAHDVIPVKSAEKYLAGRGYSNLTGVYDAIKPVPNPYLYIGSTKEVGGNRVVFGEAVNMVLDTLTKEEAAAKVLVIDSAFLPPLGLHTGLITKTMFV